MNKLQEKNQRMWSLKELSDMRAHALAHFIPFILPRLLNSHQLAHSHSFTLILSQSQFFFSSIWAHTHTQHAPRWSFFRIASANDAFDSQQQFVFFAFARVSRWPPPPPPPRQHTASGLIIYPAQAERGVRLQLSSSY